MKRKISKYINLIEKEWPGTVPPKLKDALKALREALGNIAEKRSPAAKETRAEAVKTAGLAATLGRQYFDILALIRKVLISHDLFFLSRQVTYHISVDAELPDVFADPDQVQFLFSQMVEHLIKRSARSSRLSVVLKKYMLRGGPGIEITFSTSDRYLTEKDQQEFLSGLFQGGEDKISGVSLTSCRTLALRESGQLWVDVPKTSNPVYHLALPSTEQATALSDTGQQTFKYDILISNYSTVRKRFGIRKSVSLLSQIEHYIRSLVRYPIDMVMSLGDKGMITTIYETPRGTAQSVASRISERLGSEKFCIGKKMVDISFSYRLSPLSQISPARNKAGHS